MSFNSVKTAGANQTNYLRLSVLAFFAAFFVLLGGAAHGFGQEGNQYEEPWHPAARFAVKEGGKKEKAKITLVKVEKASFQTGETGLSFQICLTVKVKKGRRKTVRQYARTDVFRNDKTMAYTLLRWQLLKTPPPDCR